MAARDLGAMDVVEMEFLALASETGITADLGRHVTAVAAFLASRTAPENAAPTPKGSYTLPFACGSQPN